MSYCPTFIIRKSDLEVNREKIESASYTVLAKKRTKRNEEKMRYLTLAYEALERALKYDTIKFPEIELVVFPPRDTSSENKAVRDLLDELKIDYQTDN